MIRENLKGHMALLGANVIFGLNAPIAKSVLNAGYLNASSLSFLRMAGAGVLCWIASLMAQKEKIRKKDILTLVIASLLGIVLNQFGFMVGLSMTSPVDALILETQVPIVTMLLAAVFLREPITFKKAFGVAVGASGALLLIFPAVQQGTAAGGTVKGNLIVMASGVAYSLYFTIFRDLIKRYSPITLMKWMFLFSTIMCAPVCYDDMMQIDLVSFTWDIYLMMAYVIGFATFLAYILLPVGQKRLRPTVVSMYIYAQPVVATSVAVLIGQDRFGWEKGIAAVLVFLGVYLVTRSKSREQLLKERGQQPEA